MDDAPRSVRETLLKDHRVFERLADAVDRSRLRSPREMRELLGSALDALVTALEAHEELETAAFAAVEAPPPAWEKDRRTAELQHDGIAALIKDVRIIVADPARYRPDHLASLAYLLSRALREHVSFEEERLFKRLALPERPAPPPALDALRRVEAMLGRM